MHRRSNDPELFLFQMKPGFFLVITKIHRAHNTGVFKSNKRIKKHGDHYDHKEEGEEQRSHIPLRHI
jgi:hypothetical protein